MSMNCVQRLVRKAARKKDIVEAQSMETPLNRCLSVWHLVFYGLAHMAGAGIYVLSGTIVKNYAGPAASLSFLSCSVAAIFTGMCYVEFASLIPRAGSSYTYTYCVLGELPAFVVGWTMLFDYVLGMASVAKAFSGTVDSLSRRKLSGFLIARLGHLPKGWSALDDTWDLPAVALILVLALLVLGGAKFSLSVNAVLSSLQLLCLIAITGAAFAYGSVDNWTSGGGFFPFGAAGVLEGASIAMFAFSGFESVGTAAEESRDPKRDLPRALMGSLAAVSVLYVAATLGISYLQPYWQLDVAAPFVSAFAEKPQAKWAEVTAAVGTLLATGATKVSGLFVIPRVMYALASDGVICGCFASVNKRVQVPLLGLAFGAITSSLLALVFRLQFLAEMVSVGTLVSYCIIGVDLFVLRYFHYAGSGESAVAPMRTWASGLSRLLPCLARVRALGWLFAAYLVACLALAGAIECAARVKAVWCWGLVGPAGAAVLLLMAALSAYQPHDIPGMYCSPLMPMAPLVTVLVNSVMLVRLSMYTWLRFLVWLKIGLTIYTLYGLGGDKTTSDGDNRDERRKSGGDLGGTSAATAAAKKQQQEQQKQQVPEKDPPKEAAATTVDKAQNKDDDVDAPNSSAQ